MRDRKPADAPAPEADADGRSSETPARHVRRFTGYVRLAAGRVAGRLRPPVHGRTLFAVLGVAVAVALMVTVTGVALGLASQATVESEDVDYWILPEDGSLDSILVDADSTALSDVHATTRRLNDDDRVDYATPVQMQVLQVENRAAGAEEYVLAVGILPPSDDRSVADVPAGTLDDDYPHYDEGRYTGPWTGEAVASTAAADLLDAETGTRLHIESGNTNRSFRIEAVAGDGVRTGVGPLPVLVVPLAELQTLTGTASTDQADQILVSTTDPNVRDRLEGTYPETTVVSRDGLYGSNVASDDVSLAVAASAVAVALAIGTLFVATMMGLEVSADRRRLTVLGMLGVSLPARAFVVAVETVVVSLLGGVGGVVLGAGGIVATNAVSSYLGVGDIARLQPRLAAYGLVVAVGIGMLAALYPAALTRRTTDLTEVTR